MSDQTWLSWQLTPMRGCRIAAEKNEMLVGELRSIKHAMDGVCLGSRWRREPPESRSSERYQELDQGMFLATDSTAGPSNARQAARGAGTPSVRDFGLVPTALVKFCRQVPARRIGCSLTAELLHLRNPAARAPRFPLNRPKTNQFSADRICASRFRHSSSAPGFPVRHF